MKKLLLPKVQKSFQTEIPLPSSKSESNRALIINALAQGKDNLSNLAEARDTQTMMRLLASDDAIADVIDAGTTMRFLTAYFAVTGQHKTMTGTPRMCERPIGILVDALRSLGADIEYLNKEGYPPLQLNGFNFSGNNHLAIRGDVSSQYISAILMIAPLLPEGLILTITGELGSKPYIEMTIQQMKSFGITVSPDWENLTITVPAQKYEVIPYAIESDWSGASYWFSIVALSEFEDAELELLGLKENSLQGDSVITDIMSHLGVKSEYTGRGFKLTKIPAESTLAWDFTNCPDLAQTVCVVAAAKNIPLTLTGVESLKVKETDRIYALQTELAKIGASLVETEKNHKYLLTSSNQSIPAGTSFHTYDDHRMAMAFAPLALIADVEIEEPDVVVKSYPSFWKHLAAIVDIEA
ncbi:MULTISPECIES: 3-phosphoshikimate 1-carboxyvinyltransferase [unclassified Arcicella]|uniref:3-phosphoshikimate 1-carboxyvinyltransferase n=1 Tax=unclassified Arcicella TaxID=2644986 RepID=UPI002859E61A|nr:MULTISPECIES: 3-phosphoshikimate 1-carboxyvinyltransferase [unclassified Arcicella]MDR6560699.1 3-phosphoshikimate 1-carboxyvinyltransferase [Arcicella sp. BE51]MDR6810583.1 3-phosphoshikimate 1-carboxyvinyltransferase [Arcicella sp. BE140]MDR6821933.1 3-phosphoshikimate 1-carboxyvinyltransferase [Arcicella sp. BE139]